MDEILARYAEEAKKYGTLELTSSEWLEEQARVLNNRVGNLPLIDCPRCKNRGEIAVVRDGGIVMTECGCMTKRRAMRRMKESGLEDVISRYTFGTFQTNEDWQRAALETCEGYAENPSGWLLISGNPGTGKTHLCTAVCGGLLKAGYDVRYFLWRTEAPVLKAYAGTPEYAEKVRPYKEVKVLYIDDFLKARAVTDADINLAFDILNARYNNTSLLTIISSERTMEEMLDLDEAVGSRIYERRQAYIKTVGKENWRLRDERAC